MRVLWVATLLLQLASTVPEPKVPKTTCKGGARPRKESPSGNNAACEDVLHGTSETTEADEHKTGIADAVVLLMMLLRVLSVLRSMWEPPMFEP